MKRLCFLILTKTRKSFFTQTISSTYLNFLIAKEMSPLIILKTRKLYNYNFPRQKQRSGSSQRQFQSPSRLFVPSSEKQRKPFAEMDSESPDERIHHRRQKCIVATGRLCRHQLHSIHALSPG